eukprot:624472-Ditylum_brightwellii.AAC.1
MKTSELAHEEKAKGLNAVNLIKIKHSGMVEGSSYADGIKEQFYIRKEESITSSAVALESLIPTLIVDILRTET